MMEKLRLVCRWMMAIGLITVSLNGWAAGPLNVVVSIKPVHSIVAGLMKDIGQPTLLIKDGQTPYDFKLNALDKKKLAESTLVIWVGPELELSIQPAISQLPDTVEVIELLSSPGMKILPSRQHPDSRDPFFWMDDRNVMIMLDELTELLIRLDPARSHVYARNRREMLTPLRRIDREYEYGYKGMKAGLGVMYFDTLRYFEQAYALKTLGRVSGSPRDAEQATYLLKVRSQISDQQAACLFIDKSMPARNIELLTQGQQINIGELDTLGLRLKAGPGLYLKLMQYNTDVIKQCLNADMDEATKARMAAYRDDGPAPDGIGGRFILTDHMGQPVTEQEMKGHYSLIFFGYTFCPDICPVSLMVLSQALGSMGESARLIQPYFISIDPQRDTVEHLRDYVGHFYSRLIGLTGSEAMIKRVADQFNVSFEKGEVDPSDPGLYAMDHTASLFLMAPDSRFITKFAYGISADALAKQLSDITGR